MCGTDRKDKAVTKQRFLDLFGSLLTELPLNSRCIVGFVNFLRVLLFDVPSPENRGSSGKTQSHMLLKFRCNEGSTFKVVLECRKRC